MSHALVSLVRMPSDLLQFECSHATHDESIQITAAVYPLALHVFCVCVCVCVCALLGQGSRCTLCMRPRCPLLSN
jgi:hypothetical protein